MTKAKINGYAIEINKTHNRRNSRFITLTDEQGKRHYFNMIKPDGEWVIRNPETVQSFIVEIEKELAKVI